MSSENPTSTRRSDLDALRAVAMLLGIVLHAALTFTSFWIVTDRRQEPAFGILFSALHGFRMPVFFVMSGYFSAMLLRRRGRAALVKHRFSRVFLPLLLGMVTIVPATNWISYVAISAPSKKPAASLTPEASSLWEAAEAGDLGEIDRHLANGAAIDALDEERAGSPLTWAAFADRVEAIELLIERGANVNAVNRDGATPLLVAAFLGQKKAVETLVEKGAQLNAANVRGETPLDAATIDEGTTRLIASAIHIDLKDGVALRKAEIAEYLRQHGATAGKKASTADLLMQLPLFAHLWFLWFLWWLVLGLAAVSALGERLPRFRLPPWLVLSPARYLWLIPLTMIPQSFMRLGESAAFFGPDPSTGLLPIPHVLAYYAIFFGFGALYFGFDDQSGRVDNRWSLALPVALLLVFPLGTALAAGWTGPLGLALAPLPRRTLSLFLQATYPWLMTFGLMDLFRRACPAENPKIRYLSDSAYWLYLAHVPLVIAAQLVVRDWPLPALAKFLLILVVVTSFLLWTYQVFVRYTWLGRFLNGPRVRPVPAPAAAAPAAVA
jgi:hypothetical protein